jgi:hypothetical protein
MSSVPLLYRSTSMYVTQNMNGTLSGLLVDKLAGAVRACCTDSEFLHTIISYSTVLAMLTDYKELYGGDAIAMPIFNSGSTTGDFTSRYVLNLDVDESKLISTLMYTAHKHTFILFGTNIHSLVYI